MKTKFFDLSLYLDSLKRSTLIGGLFTALLCIQSFITAFGYRIMFTGYQNVTVRTVGLLEMNPMLLVVPFLMMPLLMFNLFGFLTKRSTSDFWHSTPFKRECLFFTFCLAALSWAVAAIILSSACSVVSFALMPKFFVINFASVFSVIISTVVITLMVMGAFTVSQSLTGTTFNNIIIACIILFLPRALIIYFEVLTSHSYLFSNITSEGIGSISLNLIFGALVSSLNGSDFMTEAMSSPWSIIYSLVVAIVYIAIGTVLFKRRKSESASYSAVNRHLQTAFRIIVAFIVCLIPIYITVLSIVSKDRHNSEELFIIVVLYIVALAVYLIYELITTKKAVNMLKALPKLWILVVANVVMILAAVGIYNAEYNFTPSPETVKSIRIASQNSTTRRYFDKMMSETDIQDPELEELLCDAYVFTRKAYEDKTLYKNSGQIIKVGFKTGFGYKYRTVFLVNENYEEFTQLLDKNETVKNIYNIENILPKAISYEAHIYVGNDKEWSDSEKNTVIDTYIEDIKAIPFPEWYAIVAGGRNIAETDKEYKYYNDIGSVSIYVNIKGISYYVNLPINNQMPRTYSYIYGKVHEEQSEKGLKDMALNALLRANSPNNNVYVELYNGTTKTNREGYNVYGDNAKKLYDILINAPDVAPTAESRIAILRFEEQAGSSTEYYDKDMSYTVILKIPDDADLKFLLGTFNN